MNSPRISEVLLKPTPELIKEAREATRLGLSNSNAFSKMRPSKNQVAIWCTEAFLFVLGIVVFVVAFGDYFR